jgi:hypothetical protein
MSDFVSNRCSALILMAIVMLAGCTGKTPPLPPALPIAKEISFRLPDAETLSSEFDASQIVVASWGDRVFNFEVHLRKERNRVVVAAVDPLGNRMLSYTWVGQEVQVEYAADGLSGPLSPKSLAAHLALIFWPGSYVGHGLIEKGTALVDTQNERIVTKDGKAIISVTYSPDRRSAWNGRSQVRHSEFDYKIFITSVVK